MWSLNKMNLPEIFGTDCNIPAYLALIDRCSANTAQCHVSTRLGPSCKENEPLVNTYILLTTIEVYKREMWSRRSRHKEGTKMGRLPIISELRSRWLHVHPVFSVNRRCSTGVRTTGGVGSLVLLHTNFWCVQVVRTFFSCCLWWHNSTRKATCVLVINNCGQHQEETKPTKLCFQLAKRGPVYFVQCFLDQIGTKSKSRSKIIDLNRKIKPCHDTNRF